MTFITNVVSVQATNVTVCMTLQELQVIAMMLWILTLVLLGLTVGYIFIKFSMKNINTIDKINNKDGK